MCVLEYVQFYVNKNLPIYIFRTGIYGGNMLGVRSVSGLALYDWDSTELVRRIEITPKHVSWL